MEQQACVEVRLLLALLSRAQARGQTGAGVAAPDAQKLLQLACWHGVAALALRGLRRGGLAVKPAGDLPGFAQRLQERARADSFQSLAQLAGLREIASALKAAELPVIAWKGVTLAQALYGDSSMRASCDIDLLVRHQDLPRATRVLEQLAFQPATRFLTAAAAARANHLNCEAQFCRARDRLAVELHDEFMPRLFGSTLAIEQCLVRAEWAVLGKETRVRTLAPADLLISLCLHGAKHGWDRLKWVCDVAAFTERYAETIDWAALLPAARQAGVLEPLLTGLRLAESMLAATLPAPVSACTRHKSASRRSIAAIERRISAGLLEERPVALAMQDALRALSSPAARLRYLVRRSLTINALDVERFGLPARWNALYYPLRMVRLLRRAIAGAD